MVLKVIFSAIFLVFTLSCTSSQKDSGATVKEEEKPGASPRVFSSEIKMKLPAEVLEKFRRAIEKEQGSGYSFNLDYGYMTKDSIIVTYRRMIGDGGIEKCHAEYRRRAKTIRSLVCDYRYLSSFGNKNTVMVYSRLFDDFGDLKSVKGNIKVEQLNTNKLIEERMISNGNDAALREVTVHLSDFPYDFPTQ